MFRQIVVGVDGHEGGRDAIALAKHLLARDGQLTLAHVLAHDGHRYWGSSAADEASAGASAAQLLEKVQEETGVHAQLRWRASGSVGRGLHELCELTEADLLTVGSSRRGLLGRVMIGDHTRAALNGAPCAIAIAPTNYAREQVAMREIGVGYNGSSESGHALDLARRLAAGTGAKLSAFETVSLSTSSFDAHALPLSEAVHRLVNEARDRITALGGVEAHAAYGDPAEELALYSASLDLLVVGSRDYGPIGRLVHGSTSKKLARMARCPLLVLPRSARTIEARAWEEAGREPVVAARE
jgi:nucleotide-binding universal stress UspA family protein